MAKLTITRDKSFAGMLRALSLVLDGERIGKLRRGQQIELTISPGPHKFAVQVDFLHSGEVSFEAGNHDRIRAECGYKGYGGSLRLYVHITGHNRLVW